MNSMSNLCYIIFITFICVDIIIVEGNQSRSLFLTPPGGGGEVVYAPVGHNTTLTCAVSGIELLWEVNGFRFGESTDELHRRGIFQSQLMNISNIILTSTLSLFSDSFNDGASICCLARMTKHDTSLEMCCTMLSVYYPPAQPVFKLPEYVRSNGSVKLSWMVNRTQGVDHNYTIVIHNVTTTTPSQMIVYETVVQTYFLFEECGRFDVQVRAVNEAGESEPSDTVRLSLPLLPDIQPVSDSLQHKLWKLSGHGQVMLQIQFEPAYFCSEAIIQYCILLWPSVNTGNGIKLCVHSNQTEFLLGPDNGLEGDTFYEYVITAVNDFGNRSSITKSLSTYDIQSVTIRRVMDNIRNIDIDCHFINGSDAKGCKVVIVSDHPSVDDITTMLIRSNESDLIASGQLTLTYHIDCYHHVLAFDIEANDTISVNWAIREGIGPKSETPQCNGAGTNVLSSVTILSVTLTVGIIISVLLS